MGNKIAVTSAFGWPYVRRGNRVAFELALYLARQGNEVHFITTKPGEVRREKPKGNLLIKYYPLIDHPLLTRLNVEYWQTFALTCIKALLKEKYDLVHTCLTMDTCAAGLLETIRGTPFVPVLINGDPLYKDARRAGPLFRRALQKASRLVTISNFVNDILKRDFDMEGLVIPCPVDTSKFWYSEKKKTEAPRILCTAALTMERKRVPLLVKAFEQLAERMPHAVLQLAGETNHAVTNNLLMSVNEKVRDSIEIVDITSDEVLSSYYREADITVLPSLKEPFGMVTMESLACGTPVVGTRSGGTAEILNNTHVGVLFEPSDGPKELCEALIKGIELARDPDTSKRCNEYAQRYSWDALGPKYEELHREILDSIIRKSGPLKKIPENRRTSAALSDEFLPLTRAANKAALRTLFVNLLDELEITTQTYYEFESCMPRCLYILEWLEGRGMRGGTVLVLSAYPHFLAKLLKKLNFRTKHIVMSNGADRTEENDDYEKIQDPQSLVHLQGCYDVIVCDDILQNLVDPDLIFEIFKKHLAHAGMAILTIPNVNRWGKRFNVVRTGDTSPLYKREYSLAEVQKVSVNAGFAVIHKSYITGEKRIYNSNNFAHIPVNTYFVQKLQYVFERVAVPCRSHLFVALKAKERNA